MQVINPLIQPHFSKSDPHSARSSNFQKAEVFRTSIISRWNNPAFKSQFISTLQSFSPQKKLLTISSILSNIIQLFPESERSFWTLMLAVCSPEIMQSDDPRFNSSPADFIDTICERRENSEQENSRMLADYFRVAKLKSKNDSVYFRETMDSYRSLFLTMAISQLLDQVEMAFSPDSNMHREDGLFNPLYMRKGMQTYHEHMKQFASDEWLNSFYGLVNEVNVLGHCEALDKIIQYAEVNNNPIAQHYLSRIFFDGHKNIAINTKKGITYMKRSAKQGYALAQDDYAMKLVDGNGVKKNLRAYRRYLKKSAESGYIKAQYHLGVSYTKGIGCKINHLKAIKWFSLASNNTYFSNGEEETVLLARNNLHLLQEGFDEPTLRAAAHRASSNRVNRITTIVVNVLIIILTVVTVAVVVGLIASVFLI